MYSLKLPSEILKSFFFFLSATAPHSPEPYLTLATVYEERGEQDKLLQILAIAANLKRSDGELWVKTATLAVERENLSLAVECFSKGV